MGYLRGLILLLVGCLALGWSRAGAQDSSNPPAPSEQQNPPAPPAQKKDEGMNPAQAAAEVTKKIGVETLSKLRDWENGWLTGPYVGRKRELVPLTDHQRQRIYLQQTLTTPSAYVKRMFVAGMDQLRDSPAQWGEGWGAYGERFASREGQFISANSVAALGNWALKYEPRYDQCRCSGFKLRTRHAILRNFLTYNQTEREMRPQWGLYAGAFSGGVISSTWKPHPRSAWADGGYAVLGQAGYGSLLNFFIEFAGDINRKLGARRRAGGGE